MQFATTRIAIAICMIAICTTVLCLEAAGEVPPTPNNQGETPPESSPGDSWTEPFTGMRFRYAPPGTFVMGSPEDEPYREDNETQHRVTLTRGFWIGETEVTQGQWRTVVGNNPAHHVACGEDCPVDSVSWYEAISFANEMSKLAGLEPCYELVGCEGTLGGGCPGILIWCDDDLECTEVRFLGLGCPGYRLPTEAEWEYAVRAPQSATTESREGMNQPGNPNDHSKALANPRPTGQDSPNSWGLHDVTDNVWEWVQDAGVPTSGLIITGTYVDGIIDPLSTKGERRLCRGAFHRDYPDWRRPASRHAHYTNDRFVAIGFRLVRTEQ